MKDKDLSQAPLAKSVSYNGPLSWDTIGGRDDVTRFLRVFDDPRGLLERMGTWTGA
jgi:hypothetical protein